MVEKNLEQAFQNIANAVRALDKICKEPGFHNPTWQAAFKAAFDSLEGLKAASAKDAATLGKFYCEQVYGLINKLIDQTENNISLDKLFTLCCPQALDEAIRAFGRVSDELFLQEAAVAVAEEACNAG